ncbi:MAG: hypothetical protein JXB14_03155 [Candidatus Altiarchaeota archaeon]|nr:hypothetical protein [Candidatus Altiarchaeota archaeon]
MAKVLDSSGIINARDKEIEGSYVTIPEIQDELKDIQSRNKFEIGLAQGAIRIEDPQARSIADIRESAERNGVLLLLSDVDIKVLALALEKRSILVTDDYDMQNMCKILGLKFERISEKGIKETYRWRKKCLACGKEYKEDLIECEVCGSRRFRAVRA